MGYPKTVLTSQIRTHVGPLPPWQAGIGGHDLKHPWQCAFSSGASPGHSLSLCQFTGYWSLAADWRKFFLKKEVQKRKSRGTWATGGSRLLAPMPCSFVTSHNVVLTFQMNLSLPGHPLSGCHWLWESQWSHSVRLFASEMLSATDEIPPDFLQWHSPILSPILPRQPCLFFGENHPIVHTDIHILDKTVRGKVHEPHPLLV